MKLINNRYRIVKILEQNRMFSNYIALDMWNKNQKMQLTILNAEFTPSSLIDFYSNEFISLINLKSNNIVKNYFFNRVSYINNKENTKEQYFYTCEYIGKSKNLLEYINDMNLFETIDVFIEICRAINYLHLKGYVYSELNLNNIFIIKNNENYKVKLNDLATVELQKNYYTNDKIDNSYFKSPNALTDENPNREIDIYSLAVILLTMLRKEISESNPRDELAIFREELKNNANNNFTSSEIEYIIQILHIIEKFITSDKPYDKNYVYGFISQLNSILDKNYEIFCKKELEKLNFHTKLIGREDEINSIIKAYNSMMEFKPNNKIFLIKGNSGTGKTRFLEEIKFLLQLKKANIYSSFSLSSSIDSNDKLWTEILKKLISETDNEIINKYQSELMKFFPEIVDRKSTTPLEYLDEDTTKYRLLNRIAAFINDSIQNKPTVFIIDDIHLANEFTIDILTYLYKEIINNKNIILIFSYKDGKALNDEKFSKFITDINKRKDSEIIHIKNLNKKQTAEMIKEMTSMHYTTVVFSSRIYSQSYGNPLFISEIMKELFNSKMLYIDDKSGLWHINIPNSCNEDDYYKYLSIEQSLLNQLDDIDDISYEILKTISICNNPISIKNLSMLTDIKFDELEHLVQTLVNNGILAQKIEDRGYVYEINNEILKDIIYKKINKEEKIQKHKIVANLLESENDFTGTFNIDELIFHLENSNNKAKAKEYCIKNAEKMRALKNIKGEIKNLEKALSMVDNANLIEKTELLIEIGILYLESGNYQSAINCFTKAEELADITKNHKTLIDVYINMAQVMNLVHETEETIKYLDKADKALENYEYLEASLEVKRIKTILLIEQNLIDESIQLILEIIEECGNDLNKAKGNAYRHLAYIYSHLDRFEEALNLYEKSIELFETVNYTRGILVALNNIGNIYLDNYNLDSALNYFIKVKDLGEEYNLLPSELIGLINIAVVYHIQYDYKIAYNHFKLALEKALNMNNVNMTFYTYLSLTNLCIDMNNYSEAYYYCNLAKKHFEKYPNLGINIPRFYRASANLFKAYGDFKKANKYFIKAINFYKNKEAIENLNNIIDSNIIKIRFKDINTYNSNIEKILTSIDKLVNYNLKIITLCETSIILSRKNDFKNAKKLLSEAEKYMTETLPDQIKAMYYYTKGIVEKENSQIETLIKALKLAKKVKNKELIAKINTELGNYYFNQKNYYLAANYYIEACEILKKLIFQVPDEYKLTYVNSYKLALPFYRIKYIENILDLDIENNTHNNKQFEKLKDIFEVNSYEELSKLINSDETNAFINNKEFMQFISKQYMHSDILTEKDVLINLNGNTNHDIKLIIKYLAAITLATKGLVIIEDQKQDLNVISSTNNDYNLPSNKYIFNRVKITKEPLLISDKLSINKNDANFLLEDIKSYLCIPIIANNPSTKQNILAYLYLESDRALNNFNHKGLQKCIEFSNLLAILIEKHQLQIAASIDKLTGALTRKYLEDSLNNLLDSASSNKQVFSIIMYDLDRFKRVNDRFGHPTGDEVLRKMSTTVMENIGPKDILGRYGGEEFIIILPNIGVEEAFSKSNYLREKIQNEKILGDKIDITVSMGITTYPTHGQTINELIAKVDQALYVAKEKGRNRCQIWSNEFENILKPRNAIGGIITGNEVQDSRNILALVELTELTNKDLNRNEKIYAFLGRTIEVIEAQFGILLLVDDCGKIIESFEMRAQKSQRIDKLDYNQDIVKSVINNKQGLYMIDWDKVKKHDSITGLPDWYSVLAVPIINKDKIKGVVYLSTSTKIKEFSVDDFNFVNVLSNLLANILIQH